MFSVLKAFVEFRPRPEKCQSLVEVPRLGLGPSPAHRQGSAPGLNAGFRLGLPDGLQVSEAENKV